MLEVAVHDRHERRGAGHDPLDHCAGEAPASDPVQALDPGIHRGDGLDLGRRPVGRVVIDEDDLPADIAQGRLDEADEPAHIGPLVECRDNDSQFEAPGGG